MVFGIRRKDARDMQEAPDNRRVPYRLASYEHDHEGKRFKSGNVVYSFWSAAKYTLIISLMLWWLPMFGQMIAGYVGGRRAGGPWKGVAAAILPVVCLYAVITGFENGTLPSHVFGVAIAPAAIQAALMNGVPFISPYLQFSSDYLGAFVSALEGSSPYGINTYVITVAFAYVGGVLAEQSRREIEFNSGSVMSNTTVLVADSVDRQQMPVYRPRHTLAHSIGSVFPWGNHEVATAAIVPAHSRHSHKRDAWANAAQLNYDDDDEAVDVEPDLAPPVRSRPASFSAATTQRSPKRHHGHRPYYGPRNDPWVRAERRVKNHYSSSHRFKYDDSRLPQRYTEAPRAQVVATRRLERAERIVPGDARSVRRANKMIDHEWGRKTFPAVMVEDDDGPAVEADVAVQHHRKEHRQGAQWDSI